MGCATKIPFEQTCLTCTSSQRIGCKQCPETFMVGNNCFAMIDEIGEKINLDYILSKENITPKSGIPLTLGKIRGRYFVVGQDFKHMWILTPVKDKAKAKKLMLPQSNLQLPPVFEISDKNLLIRGQKNEYSYYLDIDKLK